MAPHQREGINTHAHTRAHTDSLFSLRADHPPAERERAPSSFPARAPLPASCRVRRRVRSTGHASLPKKSLRRYKKRYTSPGKRHAGRPPIVADANKNNGPLPPRPGIDCLARSDISHQTAYICGRRLSAICLSITPSEFKAPRTRRNSRSALSKGQLWTPRRALYLNQDETSLNRALSSRNK